MLLLSHPYAQLLHRFCKPLDMVLLRQMAREHPVMITVEENGIGGFGSHGKFQFLMQTSHLAPGHLAGMRPAQRLPRTSRP